MRTLLSLIRSIFDRLANIERRLETLENSVNPPPS